MTLPRITFNSPVILTFFLISLLLVIIGVFHESVQTLFAAVGPPRLTFEYFLRLFLYPFAHANFAHFTGNFAILLLIGPILEEKYGSKLLLIWFVGVSVTIGLIQSVVFSEGIIGASGLAFFSIMLVSMTNFKKGQLPLTLILVALLYLGNEVIGVFRDDNISQAGHILGGVCGILVGFALIRGRSSD